MKLFFFTIISSLCLSTACNNIKKTAATSKQVMPDPSELTGNWQLDYINASNLSFKELYPDKKPGIVFDLAGSRISGNAGCNNFSGPVTIIGSKMSFDQPLAITKMMCPGQGEAIFLETLKKIDSWALTDSSTLHFIMGDIAMMRFVRIN